MTRWMDGWGHGMGAVVSCNDKIRTASCGEKSWRRMGVGCGWSICRRPSRALLQKPGWSRM